MKQTKKQLITPRTLAYCALLAALSVVLARMVGLMPSQAARYSIEAVPIFIAGMLFGPLPGAMVGFVADFVGCLFSAYGYNPIFSVPPILYGLFAGLFQDFLANKVSFFRLVLAFLPPVILGSVLYQSAALTYMYYKGSFLEGFLLYLSTRSVQFTITMLADVLIIRLLYRSGLFVRIGVWPPQNKDISNKKEMIS